MMSPDLTNTEIARRVALQNSNPKGIAYPDGFFQRSPRAAAVLIPLLRKENAWHILLIRRTKVEGDMHSGQVAFPGGAQEAQDATSERTALRETYEEIGLPPEKVEVLGVLPTTHTISNFLLTPIVGVIPWPFELKLSQKEVSRVFTIPLDWLMDETNTRYETRQIEPYPPFEVIYFDTYDNEQLWGVSASIIVEFLSRLREDHSRP